MNRPILLVDDNPMDVELTQLAFRKSRLTNPIIVARDGEEALTWIPRWQAGEPTPVVILLDINMPRVNGLEVLQALRADPVSRLLPVVVLTTSSTSRDVAAAYNSGANSYIVKPVDFGKFRVVAEQIELFWTVLNVPPS
ncbi:MAG: response regulator [Burkholderiales bacterium]|nr:response regulator [Burkholderiales bacterium]